MRSAIRPVTRAWTQSFHLTLHNGHHGRATIAHQSCHGLRFVLTDVLSASPCACLPDCSTLHPFRPLQSCRTLPSLLLRSSRPRPSRPRPSRPTKAVQVTAPEGDTGVTRPLGVYDPLGLIETRDMRRYEVMEIKQAARPCLASSTSSSSTRALPGYLSPSSASSSRTCRRLPCVLEASRPRPGSDHDRDPHDGDRLLPVRGQRPVKAPGDIGGELWTRYEDKATKAFKLNVERNNGRAAMMGITGCSSTPLGVDALYRLVAWAAPRPGHLLNTPHTHSSSSSRSRRQREVS